MLVVKFRMKVLHSPLPVKFLNNRDHEKKVAVFKTIAALKRAAKKSDSKEFVKMLDTNLRAFYEDLIQKPLFVMKPSKDMKHECYQKDILQCFETAQRGARRAALRFLGTHRAALSAIAARLSAQLQP